jgi:elongation factor 2 kinase
MSQSEPTRKQERKNYLLQLLQNAAAKLMEEGDPWKKYKIQDIPAERVVRHLYHPLTQTWSTDETIVKMEDTPFTHGAMRYCYRMKKRSTPPSDATNHHYHKMSWSYASNYVAKAYITANTDGVPMIDTSNDAKQNIKNDIVLQYEAQYWAEKYNQQNPPKTIHFLRAYVIEFPNREGQPWFAVERYITGTDMYGAGYIKHNTNSGYVDHELRRVTPQIFSAYTFYASFGHRLVADIQGIGDLYTDPQVLSSDYRFGDGDLGPRGMAFFMTHFRDCTSSDALGIPIFPLSKNEIKYHQMKYDDDEVTLSDDDDDNDETDNDSFGNEPKVVLDPFQKLDLNRRRRSTILQNPMLDDDLLPISRKDTMRRSNRSKIIQSPGDGKAATIPKPIAHYKRTKSDVDDIQLCIQRAKHDHIFTHHDFHRHGSGELKERQYKSSKPKTNMDNTTRANGDYTNVTEKALRSTMVIHKSAVVRNGRVAKPIPISDDTRMNLGRVHYQLAVLHGSGRFPEIVPVHEKTKDNSSMQDRKDYRDTENQPNHDVYTVLFHLSYGASLQNTASCLSLGRVLAGLTSQVSSLLPSIVSIDFDSSKILLNRAMTSPYPPSKPKVAAGSLLFQILRDEQRSIGIQQAVDNDTDESLISNVSSNTTTEMMQVIEDTIQLMNELEKEDKDLQEHRMKQKQRHDANAILVGDRVEANYALEGTFYPAIVEEIVTNGEDISYQQQKQYVVRYEDDGTSESLSSQNIRAMIPPTATQTTLGGPLSDEEVFHNDSNESDDIVYIKKYELQVALARMKEQCQDRTAASILYELAANGAIIDGKMQSATLWSLKAAELQST